MKIKKSNLKKLIKEMFGLNLLGDLFMGALTGCNPEILDKDTLYELSGKIDLKKYNKDFDISEPVFKSLSYNKNFHIDDAIETFPRNYKNQDGTVRSAEHGWEKDYSNPKSKDIYERQLYIQLSGFDVDTVHDNIFYGIHDGSEVRLNTISTEAAASAYGNYQSRGDLSAIEALNTEEKEEVFWEVIIKVPVYVVKSFDGVMPEDEPENISGSTNKDGEYGYFGIPEIDIFGLTPESKVSETHSSIIRIQNKSPSQTAIKTDTQSGF